MEKASEFQVGDVVWDVIYGKGVVTCVEDSDYPIQVTFSDNENEWDSFTADGRRYLSYPRTLVHCSSLNLRLKRK